MKELIIYDFDGVLFKDPWEIHDTLFKKYRNRFALVIQVISEKGYVPSHLYDSEDGKEYLKIFSEEYFNQRMPIRFVDQLREQSENCDLIIASYNTKSQIERLLKQSGIIDLFKFIFTDIEYGKKGEIFLMPFLNEYEKVSFVTDTVSDILEALNTRPEMNLYGVKGTHKDESEFLKYVPQENVVEPFFDR